MSQQLLVGIDLSLKYNEVCLLSDPGHTLAQRRFRHNWPGFQAPVSWLHTSYQAGNYTGLDIAAEATGGCICSTRASSAPSSVAWPSAISVTPKMLR